MPSEPAAKRLEFSASVDDTGTLCAEGRERLDPGETWTAEHLLLAALCRCTLASVGYHAKRAGVDAHGSASARGVVTKRAEDGRYAFVEIDCTVEVDAPGLPGDDDGAELAAKAERDCFIGASLATKPSYRWRVNGADVPA